MSDALPTQFCDDHHCNALCMIACAIDDVLCEMDECKETKAQQGCSEVLNHLIAANQAVIDAIKQKHITKP